MGPSTIAGVSQRVIAREDLASARQKRRISFDGIIKETA